MTFGELVSRDLIGLPGHTPLVDFCRVLHPLNRLLVSDGTDEALGFIASQMPMTAGPQVERYAPGAPAWTWTVPGRWVCDEARLTVSRGGERFEIVADADRHPLEVVAGSIPVDKTLTWTELGGHLRPGPERQPEALPWEFSYYEPTWGFCVPRRVYEALPRDAEYHALIRSHVRTGPHDGLAVAHGVVSGPDPAPGEILVVANVCHPYQVNDSITGAAVAVALAHRLTTVPLSPYSRRVRFLFCPETIGSIAYLAHHPEVVEAAHFGLFAEMLGTPGRLVLQKSRSASLTCPLCPGHHHDDQLTAIAREALEAILGPENLTWPAAPDLQCLDDAGAWTTLPFRDPRAAMNDEIVLEMAGMTGRGGILGYGIPTVALSRYPYPEYHTSADTPEILSEDQMREALTVIERLVRVAAADYAPERTFAGPLFLSGHGLWVDWRTRPQMSAAIEQIMLRLTGGYAVSEIAREVGLSFQETRAWIERLRGKGLVQDSGVRV